MGKTRAFFTIVVVCTLLNGCYNDILDPTQLGRFEPTPTVNVILDSLGVADEPSPTYEGAEEPKPEDLVDIETDYVFGSGDIVRISIFELYQIGQTYVNDYVVTETGRISIPDVGQVQAAGLTEAQLEQEIRDILSPAILKNPSVTVLLLNSESRFFSIVGQGVGQSARFQIPRYSFRLTDAIALAGGVAEFNVSYIYVSREVLADTTTSSPALVPAAETTPAEPKIKMTPVEPPKPSAEDELLNIIAPAVASQKNSLMFTTAEMAATQQLESMATPQELDPVQTPPTEPVNEPETAPATQPQSEQVKWIFEDGKWKPVRAGGQVQVSPEPTIPVSQQEVEKPVGPIVPETISQGFGIDALGAKNKVTRVLRIPVDRLLAGDPRYNVAIRPGDRITVPVDLIGEFWVSGNVNAQGSIAITGRPITLKMAIASAGGLNGIAAPQKVEVIRRIGKNKAGMMQEQIVMVDLKKISQGLQPDFFIKPYDLINVGTTGTSRWLEELRNGFRATYGFGFIYDRNFADSDLDGDPFPGHFGFNSIF
ncbi:MAG: polysaccharide biosynthesis/export family protein [Sedimentisphaerales bacterium]|nr:polysaccharide biosynthesis/export family protein [Sedimentisphaerales bacterium]